MSSREDCINLSDCLNYSAMTLDTDAADCFECLAYEKRGYRWRDFWIALLSLLARVRYGGKGVRTR